MLLLKNFEITAILRKKIIVVLILLLVALSLVEIWVVNRLSTYGEQISKLEETKMSILLENQVLQNQIDEISSLNNVEDLVKDYGFEKVKNIEYIRICSTQQCN